MGLVLLTAEVSAAVLVVEVVAMSTGLGLGKVGSESMRVEVVLLRGARQQSLVEEVCWLSLIVAGQRVMLLLQVRVRVLEEVRMMIEEGLISRVVGTHGVDLKLRQLLLVHPKMVRGQHWLSIRAYVLRRSMDQDHVVASVQAFLVL